MAGHRLFALGSPGSTILERHPISAEEELWIPQQLRLDSDHAFLSRKIITNTLSWCLCNAGSPAPQRREGELGTP